MPKIKVIPPKTAGGYYWVNGIPYAVKNGEITKMAGVPETESKEIELLRNYLDGIK